MFYFCHCVQPIIWAEALGCSSVMAQGTMFAAMGAIIQGNPDCEVQRELELKYPVSSALVGAITGLVSFGTLTAANKVLGALVEEEFLLCVASCCVSAAVDSKLLCFTENIFLQTLNTIYANKEIADDVNLAVSGPEKARCCGCSR